MIQLEWTSFKTKISELGFRYDTFPTEYMLYTQDGAIFYYCSVSKTTPKNSDQIDFEDNYLAGAFDFFKKVSPYKQAYSVPIQIRQTATTALNNTVFAMRHAAGSTKTVYIDRIYLMISFDAGTPLARSLQRYSLHKFSAATPSGGSTLSSVAMDGTNGSSQMTDIRYSDAGLTTTSVSFGDAFSYLGCPASDGATVTYVRENIGLRLDPGEGFCIRLAVGAVIGQGLTGDIVWREL